jgi:hypothetical protein
MKTRNKRLMVAGLTMLGLVSTAPPTSGNQRTDDPLGIAVSPQTLLLDKVQAGTVKVHTSIPLVLVDPLTLKLNGVPAIGAYADSLGQLVAVFDEGEIESIVSPPFAELTLTGEYITGDGFEGSDVVTVTRLSRR